MSDEINGSVNENEDLQEILKVRRQKLDELRKKGQDPFNIVRYDVTHHSKDIIDGFADMEGKRVKLAVSFKR